MTTYILRTHGSIQSNAMAKKASSKSSTASTANYSLLTDFDIHLFKMGKHFKLYEKLGAHYNAEHRWYFFCRLGTQCKGAFSDRKF